MSRVLILGAYGMLGETLSRHLQLAGHSAYRQGRRAGAEIRADPSSSEGMRRIIDETAPQVVINLIAMTNVDDCEREIAQAYLANVGIVESVVEAMGKTNAVEPAHLIHVSTDQVYGGEGPHLESSVLPINAYGLSKYAGELVAKAAGATVVRTNFVGPSKIEDKKSLSDWIVQSLSAGGEITVFDDVRFSPLDMNGLCCAIESIIENPCAGVFNVGARGSISKADFAIALAEALGFPLGQLKRGSATRFGFHAQRPTDMSMISDRFEMAFQHELPTIESVIQGVTEAHMKAWPISGKAATSPRQSA